MTENKNNIKDNKKTVPTWRFIQKNRVWRVSPRDTQIPSFLLSSYQRKRGQQQRGLRLPE